MLLLHKVQFAVLNNNGTLMSVGFVHLSDIHFGQERKDGSLWPHDDAKEQLIKDVSEVVKTLPSGRARGIIVTGDIAYGGLPDEYRQAAAWLDQVATAAGCEITDIQVVPGNHDINWDEITAATEMMLNEIGEKGEDSLDRFLRAEGDRQLLYKRFSAYLPFAEAYRCPLDTNGEHGEERLVELAPGRSIRFIRYNSALICGKKDVEGRLLLGARQRVLRARLGEEMVVLSHHPLHWFQDSEDALRFIRNRARVFISGHEHNPSIKQENIEDGCDLMLLAAGATVPPTSDEIFTYCYNVIEFDWDGDNDGLSVNVRPRAWFDEKKRFAAASTLLGGESYRTVLASPNFRNAPRARSVPEDEPTAGFAADTLIIDMADIKVPDRPEDEMVDAYALLLLRFFRDISPAQRVEILAALGALPPTWKGTLNESFERAALDGLIKAGRGSDVWSKINEILGS